MKRGRNRGLTVIEVLVALTLLGIISAGVVASFSLMSRVNRASSSDVGYSRVVRSIYERTKLDWSLPDQWESQHVSGLDLATYAENTSDGSCHASVSSLLDDAVRGVTLTCDATGSLPQQSYYEEFGRP